MPLPAWICRPRARIAIGFFVAPLLPSVVGWGLLWLAQTDLMPTDVPGGAWVGVLVVLAASSALFAAPAAWILGIPVFLFFRWRGWMGFVPTLAGGALVAVLAALALGVLSLATSPGGSERPSLLPLALVFTPFGLLSAALFWAIALRPCRQSHLGGLPTA